MLAQPVSFLVITGVKQVLAVVGVSQESIGERLLRERDWSMPSVCLALPTSGVVLIPLWKGN